MGLDPAVARYADPILAGAAGGLGSDVISAQCAAQIGLPGTDERPRCARRRRTSSSDTLGFISSFPGGNDGIMRHVLKKLVPDAIDGQGFAGVLNGRVRFDALDRPANPTRIRLGATVVRVTNLPNGSVEVVYHQDGRLHKTTAGGVVMANGAWTSQYIVADVPDSYREAFTDFVRAPMLVVNVALKRWRFMYDLGHHGGELPRPVRLLLQHPSIDGRRRLSAAAPSRQADDPHVLHSVRAARQLRSRRRRPRRARRCSGRATATTSVKIREQLVRLFGRAGFDPRADIAGVILNRWGHAYVCPAPGFYFGRNGKPAAPEVLRQPIGRIAFANSELNGHQNWVDATGEGKRAVEQLLA